MKSALRLICFYGFTVVLGLCLSLLTRPIVGELAVSAREILNTTSSTGGFDAEYFQGAMNDPRQTALREILEWSQVSYIMLVLILGALLVPKTLHPKNAADVATAISVGILTSKVFFGYPFRDWSEVFIWGVVGLASFTLVFLLRLDKNARLQDTDSK